MRPFLYVADGRIHDVGMGAHAGRAPKAREHRGAEGFGIGGVSVWGWGSAPFPENFLNFLARNGAFWRLFWYDKPDHKAYSRLKDKKNPQLSVR